jgi:hypothetical protein
MKLIRLVLAFSAALIAAACYPVTTKSPIGATVGFKPDPALFGMWRGQDEDKDAPFYFAFLKNSDGTMTAVYTSPPPTPDASGDWATYTLQAAAIGGTTFLNAQETLTDGKAPDDAIVGQTVPLLYRIGQGTLTLYFLDEKAVKDAIASGKLKGTIDPGENGDVHITEDAAKLDAMMQTKEGVALFATKPLAVLHKID